MNRVQFNLTVDTDAHRTMKVDGEIHLKEGWAKVLEIKEVTVKNDQLTVTGIAEIMLPLVESTRKWFQHL